MAHTPTKRRSAKSKKVIKDTHKKMLDRANGVGHAPKKKRPKKRS